MPLTTLKATHDFSDTMPVAPHPLMTDIDTTWPSDPEPSQTLLDRPSPMPAYDNGIHAPRRYPEGRTAYRSFSETPTMMTLRDPEEHDYDQLLDLWAQLEADLSSVLEHPHEVNAFTDAIAHLDERLQALVQYDTDAALYLMIQNAGRTTTGYSTSHALVCATLCQLLAARMQMTPDDRTVLVRAALTMNIAMTALQNRLALQTCALLPEQKDEINQHAADGRRLLELLGVTNIHWLTVVELHHDRVPLLASPPQSGARRLAHVLNTVDRYSAMISPRATRPARTSLESAREVVRKSLFGRSDDVGFALTHMVGLCPPGTFVLLDDGSIGLVLRRSATPNRPIVARLLTASNAHIHPPEVHATCDRAPYIRQAVLHTDISEELHQRSLGVLGAKLIRANTSLKGLVHVPRTPGLPLY